MNYSINVCWMYHDIMDLYGDKGNMMVLKKRCEDRGIEFNLDTCGIQEEKEQISLIPDLLSRKDNLQKAMYENTFILLICGGYQLFGQYYIAADGSKINGLGFYPYFTDTGEQGKRCIGNIVIDAKLDDLETKIIGFENHGGQTRNVNSPLGKVLRGCGNSFDAGYEGYYDGKILGTYLHGPLLPKNPEVADFVITKALQKRNRSFSYSDLDPIDNPFETKAREVLLQRFQVK